MVRPRSDHPTPAELAVLKILWEQGPLTVRGVMEHMDDSQPRAYTTVMSLLGVMHEKGMLDRQPQGKAFVYSAAADRQRTLSAMLSDLVNRAFEGSSTALVAHLLEGENPSAEDLDEIRQLIGRYRREKEDQP
ncbi:MAG: BlaI/MecI/CopY family transcriptional regulator [Pirellulales bacterium]|nr:BlaI/MecI/CopY family transcriptional regulator [Pirellulales bacterium]